MTALPEQPALSVIIPAYDQAGWLPRAIESVQAQTLEAIEIIVVDDCSSDGTADVVERLARDDPRIVCLRTPENAGPSAARHLGIEAAGSPLITTLDADDVYLSPYKLEAERDLCRRQAAAGRPAIGYSRYILLDPDLKPLPKPMQPTEPLRDGDILRPMISRSIHIPRDFTMPKDLYLDVGGYDPAIPVYEDWDLKLRLAARANFFRTDLDGTGYVQHPAGLSSTVPSEHEAWLGTVFRKNIDLLATGDQPLARQEFRDHLKARGWSARLENRPDLTERERLGEGLVFLISMPRAGSTLTQRMLTAHPAIHSRSENWLMLLPLLARATDRLWAPHNHELSVEALEDFVGHLPDGEADYRHWIRGCYAGLYRDAARAGGARYHLDKTPRYHLIWSELVTLFPRARFVLLWRHPLAVLHSMLEVMDFDRRRMDFWQIDLQRGLDDLVAFRQSGHALEIGYEDLLAEPEPTLRRITGHLKLPFEAGMLDLARDQNGSDGPLGDAKQARLAAALDPSGIDRWRHAIERNPDFTALADAYLRAHKDRIRRSPYDYDEMRRLVPEIGDTKADALVARTAGIERPPVLRSKADIARADRWQRHLARMGPLPHALGRLVWRTYRNLRR